MSPHPVRVQDLVFAAGKLSIGLTLPLLPEPQVVADFNEQAGLACLAEDLGFRALWVRDVPLNSPDYPDPVGHLDPWVLLGALAVQTRRIALISGAIVLTLRHPLHIAKGAVSVQSLSNGRFILGLGSGDRPPEYAAFGREASERRDLYARHWRTVSAAVGDTPRVIADQSPEDAPGFELLPHPPCAVPMLAVGSAGQSVDWIARHSLGWMTYHREPATQRDRYSMWRAAVDRAAPGAFRAFGVAMTLDLSDNPDEPPSALKLGYRTGRNGLLKILTDLCDNGTHHLTLNLESAQRPVREVMAELAEFVLPGFHGQTQASITHENGHTPTAP